MKKAVYEITLKKPFHYLASWNSETEDVLRKAIMQMDTDDFDIRFYEEVEYDSAD